MARSKVTENFGAKVERLSQVIVLLKANYPHAKTSLNFSNAFELLVSTVLSAQCTDEMVNRVTPALFARFPDARSMSKAKIPEIEKLIRSTGFYKNKALSLKSLSESLVEEHDGEVPPSMEKLVKLRGVGRKTANVVLGNAFGIPGLPVDTHVGRLSIRLGLTKEKDPVKVEHELMKLVPKTDWTLFSHLLILHGRALCTSRRAFCGQCFLAELCPKLGVKQ